MKKLTVFDFCSQIGAASDEIPVVVRVGCRRLGIFAAYTRFRQSLCRVSWKQK